MYKLLLPMFAVLALIGAGCAQKSEPTAPAGETAPTMQTPAEQGSSVNETQTGTNTIPGDIVYTLDEVAQHAEQNDCWMAVHGKVYDVTAFIPLHPGRREILSGCGKDATQLFESRPGSGTPHSQNARAILNDYEIGMLEQ